MGACSGPDKQPGRLWSHERRPRPSAHSLENVAREAEATPGLQKLARVFAIQLQVLNGADDLCVHISEHAVQRRRGGEEEEEGFRVRGWEGWNTHTKGGRKGQKKKTKAGRDLSATVAATLGEPATAPLTVRNGRGVALQDGCGSDVEQPFSIFFFYLHENQKETLDPPSHAAVHPLSTIIHMHTHIHTHKG